MGRRHFNFSPVPRAERDSMGGDAAPQHPGRRLFRHPAGPHDGARGDPGPTSRKRPCSAPPSGGPAAERPMSRRLFAKTAQCPSGRQESPEEWAKRRIPPPASHLVGGAAPEVDDSHSTPGHRRRCPAALPRSASASSAATGGRRRYLRPDDHIFGACQYAADEGATCGRRPKAHMVVHEDCAVAIVLGSVVDPRKEVPPVPSLRKSTTQRPDHLFGCTLRGDAPDAVCKRRLPHSQRRDTLRGGAFR